MLDSWGIDLTTLGRLGPGIDLLAFCGGGGGGGVVKVRFLVTFKGDFASQEFGGIIVMFVMFC